MHRKPSGGERPISLTYSRNLLYVLNAGGAVGTADSITGFSVAADGMLTPVQGSMQTLSAANTGPAQISFNAEGDVLVVTEKATNQIDTFTADSNGVSGPVQDGRPEDSVDQGTNRGLLMVRTATTPFACVGVQKVTPS